MTQAITAAVFAMWMLVSAQAAPDLTGRWNSIDPVGLNRELTISRNESSLVLDLPLPPSAEVYDQHGRRVANPQGTERRTYRLDGQQTVARGGVKRQLRIETGYVLLTDVNEDIGQSIETRLSLDAGGRLVAEYRKILLASKSAGTAGPNVSPSRVVFEKR